VGTSSRAIQAAQPGTSARDAEIEAIRGAESIPWINLESFPKPDTVEMDTPDEIDRIQLSPDWREKLEQARAQFRWHNPSHPPELDNYWPSERAMKYRAWILQRAKHSRDK
jgi:hypothetical protein